MHVFVMRWKQLKYKNILILKNELYGLILHLDVA